MSYQRRLQQLSCTVQSLERSARVLRRYSIELTLLSKKYVLVL